MRWIPVLFALALASVSLALGLPRVIASVHRAPAFGVLLAADSGHEVSQEQLARAIGHLEAAAQWEASGRIGTDLGLLLLLRAKKVPEDDPKREELAREAALAFREGLLRAPARPQGWLGLMRVADLLALGPSPEIAALLQQSLEAVPFIGEGTFTRLPLLLLHWEYLTEDARSSVERQISYAWEHDLKRVVEVAAQTDKIKVVRSALRDSPQALAELDLELQSLEAARARPQDLAP